MQRRNFLKGVAVVGTGTALVAPAVAENSQDNIHSVISSVSEIRPQNIKKGMMWSKKMGDDIELMFFDGEIDKRIGLYLASEKLMLVAGAYVDPQNGWIGYGTKKPLSQIHIKDLSNLPDRVNLPMPFNGIIMDFYVNEYNGIYSYSHDMGCVHWHVGADKDNWLFEMNFDVAYEKFKIHVGGEAGERPPARFIIDANGTLELPDYLNGKSQIDLNKSDTGKVLGLATDGTVIAVDLPSSSPGKMLVGKNWDIVVEAGSVKRLAAENHIEGPLSNEMNPRVHIELINPYQIHYVWDLEVRGLFYDGKCIDLRFGGRYNLIGANSHDLLFNLNSHGHYKHSNGNYVAWFEPGVSASYYGGFTVDCKACFNTSKSTKYQAPATKAIIHYTASDVTL